MKLSCVSLILSFLLLVGCTTSSTSGVETVLTLTNPTAAGLAPTSSSLPAASPIPPTQASPTGAVILTTAPELSASSTAPASTAPTRTPLPTLKPDEWKQLPVIPVVSEHVIQIYQHGLELGNNPRAFSKIGDCGSTPAWFLGDFDRGPDFYRLGDYPNLAEVIQQFQGSFGRTSLAARSGFNASSLFVALWSDRTQCQSNETPLACEYRIQRPVVAYIMLGTNDVWHPEEFEPQMRKIIEYSIQNGVVPILSTKADNAESDHSINAMIARLAMEYDVPLWNFWLATQALPDQGLQEDQAHLTWGRNFFDDPNVMSKAWPWRNLTAVQVLDAVWRKMTEQK